MAQRHEAFDEMLDECYPTYKIGTMEFYPSTILFECDPIAYQIGVVEFEDSIERDED